MTVCVAAICANNIILGASDRMLTSGDIQFEPAASKIEFLTSSITAMISGDAALLREITYGVRAEVNARLDADPHTWLPVADVAEMFVRQRNEVKLRRAEAAILVPLGLNRYTFINGMHGLDAELQRTIATDLVQFLLPFAGFIVAGVDDTGAHLYSVLDGQSFCNDAIAFCAIGSGSRHAESQMMLSQHDRTRSIAETILQVLVAKKRAEVAPGVGQQTDMITIGPTPGTASTILPEVFGRVHREYEDLIKDELQARKNALARMEQYVDQLTRIPASDQQTEPKSDGQFSPESDVEKSTPN